MPKSDHLHFDFLCALRTKLTRSGPSESLLARTSAETGGLGICMPAAIASSSRADWSGVRWYASAPSELLANTGGLSLITAKAVRRIGVVERRFLSSTTSLAPG